MRICGGFDFYLNKEEFSLRIWPAEQEDGGEEEEIKTFIGHVL